MPRSSSRRQFLKAASTGAAALSLSAASYARVAGANDRLSLGVIDLLDDYQALERASPEPFALDITHPNPRGHTFAAVAILRELVLRGAIPASADCLADLASAPGPVGEFWRLLLGTRGLPGTDPGATGRPPQGP